METTTLLAATIRTHFTQRSTDAYFCAIDGIYYTINTETFNKCIEGHYSYLKFEILETKKDIKLGKCILIELSTTGKLAERVKEQQLLNQLAKLNKETIVVTREMKKLLNKAYDAGYQCRSAKFVNHNISADSEDLEPEISFEYWYTSKLIDSTGKEDLLMTI